MSGKKTFGEYLAAVLRSKTARKQRIMYKRLEKSQAARKQG